ncbi:MULTISPECIES: VWA domain-containing protein [unclassified Lentimonas]|uniref:VWA domain-containing protein n=1 Tax=unclassified Lentimonas TaxID=2630993 RepID=UPI0013299F8A|nr:MULTISPECIES: VWA domain-containing protein [unclassified Lentimonas]CAA6678202.1 TPR domain protein in aerotolerance operon [Lentimonas sp. CC4]CAA6686591.1 TPR domain protein in aerotolerance operon [Lentimonas sp. CC6]CAA7074867.1 TPR domain protein in aerotolerance operon [Lentimonas sp. CC4]CAA7169493.1 TPR domain protein in aerotolerance operon [Lentimonas sp. CC21]CAA7179765.1 TPR domain protein in aerotolerance operon [Lentimonas sp. CC8]
MADFHFLRPWWLLAILPCALLWLRAWQQSTSLGNLAKSVDPHLLKHLLIDANSTKQFRPPHLLAATLVLSILALAGPSWKQTPAPFADAQAGLFVILRVSPTMQATDVQPTRLERARHKLSDLLEARAGTATGLIAYNGSAHLVMPLTKDDRIISTMSESLSPEIMPRDGDALGDALQLAHSFFERANMAGSILVITDSVTQSDGLSSPLPVQFWSIQSPQAPVTPEIQTAARQLNASVTKLSIDDTDVQQIARRAQSDFANASNDALGNRWQDGGYTLLPLLALLYLLNFRKGWQL